MHGYDPRHASGFGKIITRPGVAVRLTPDAVAFGARGDSTVVLLTTGNEEFEKMVDDRRAAIQQRLFEHAEWKASPVDFMVRVARLAASSTAMAESSLSNIFFDTGTSLFDDEMFVRLQAEGASLPVAWRRVCSPELDRFSKEYAVKTLSSVVSSFRTAAAKAVIDQRRKIVADTVSLLTATAAQIMHLTDGELTYIPDGHCVNIAMPMERADVVNVVINDPTGTGWKILDADTAAVATSGARLESLVEFCSKCVVDAIVKNGLDNAAMKKIVDAVSIFKTTAAQGKGHPKMAVLTSGNSTVTGKGALSIIAEDGQQHTQLPLSEYRVDVSVDRGSVAINVEPRVVNEGEFTSPSILQWYNMSQVMSRRVKNEEGEQEGKRPDDQEWMGVPVSPVSAPKQWRACQISDRVFAERSWRSRLVRAHKFEWDCKRSNSQTTLDNIAAAVAVVTHNSRAVSAHDTANQCETIDENLINATKLLCDVYGFGKNDNKPVVVLDKTEEQREIGDGEQYVLTIIGNAPSAESVRAIRVVKQKSYSANFRLQVDRSDCTLSSACKWFEISPAKIVGHPCRQNTDFLFTPRCFYHTQDESYVHLYSDGDGPYDNVTFDTETRSLEIGGGGGVAAPVAGQVIALIERPLVVAAAASVSPVMVNGEHSAEPLEVSSLNNKKTGDVGSGIVELSGRHGACSFPSSNKVISVQLSLPPPLEIQCTSSHFKCPTEAAILKYGTKRDDDTAENRAFLTLVL